MEWFWQLIEAYQKSAVYAAVRSFAAVDWFVIFAAFCGMAWGSRKGLSDMFGKAGGMLLIGVIVLASFEQFAATIIRIIPPLPEAVARPLAFLLLSIFVWLSVFWTINLIGKVFHVETRGVLKTFGGAVLGVAFFICLLSMIAQFLLLFQLEGIEKAFSKGRSFTGASVVSVLPKAQEIVTAPFQQKKSKP